MTFGESVYQHLKALPTLAIIEIVRLTYRCAVAVRTEVKTAYITGKRVTWHVVDSETNQNYSVTALDEGGERTAWLSTLERICREKWPNECDTNN